MISEEEIRKIASLAYLKLEDSEIDKFRKEFSAILDYVNKLSEIDVKNIEETADLSLINVFRKDEAEKKENKELLDLMPEKENGYLKVKEVFCNE